MPGGPRTRHPPAEPPAVSAAPALWLLAEMALAAADRAGVIGVIKPMALPRTHMAEYLSYPPTAPAQRFEGAAFPRKRLAQLRGAFRGNGREAGASGFATYAGGPRPAGSGRARPVGLTVTG